MMAADTLPSGCLAKTITSQVRGDLVLKVNEFIE
jgi:hypothetical protein